tara:strand:- start:2606 stop:2977 length:372 start_codon:yes stop_codon:yes gene_type:complete
MPKVEWGKKVVCPACETKFYDLNRKYPLTCPSCGASVEDIASEKASSEAKKVFSDDVESVSDDNLVGSDATESLAAEDEISIGDVDEDATISLEEADQDVGVIDSEVDDISIDQNESQIDEEV